MASQLCSQVYINRNSPVTSSEVFGMSRTISGGILANKFGGMYIETNGASNGKPFYGYAINNTVKAYNYFDGGDNGVHLYNGKLLLSMWPDSLQYDLGDDVRLFYDGAKLEFGKNGNTFLGKGVTPQDVSTNIANSVFGWLAGAQLESGVNNTLIGFRSGEKISGGDWNTIIGSESANLLTSGFRNTMIGYRAGWNASGTGSGNVFIGNRAGEGSRSSNRLIISNSETTTPLIDGDFDDPELKINGDARVEGETVLNGETTVNGNIGVIGQSFQQSSILNGTSPFIDFKPGGNSKFYIQYKPSGDEFIIHRTGHGDVMRIKNDGSIYIPDLAGSSAGEVGVNASGKLYKNDYPTEYEYYFLEELNTPFASDANMIVAKDLREGDLLTQMVIRSQWSYVPISENPTAVAFYKMNKVTRVAEQIGVIDDLPNTTHNQEFSTSINHIVDTDSNMYYFLVHEDSRYTYLKLIK
ncbi:hypothetical protein GCM10007940_05510 [Portibacter lacus]|uniref:Uncharacterized protein n=2 Tax=Portibacter lacus TaxID=1099794 RepID=A0AA37SMY1_9BACT|nr:hypothetical protein GCM10007940_05510 [Portibacter lacus]